MAELRLDGVPGKNKEERDAFIWDKTHKLERLKKLAGRNVEYYSRWLEVAISGYNPFPASLQKDLSAELKTLREDFEVAKKSYIADKRKMEETEAKAVVEEREEREKALKEIQKEEEIAERVNAGLDNQDY